MVVVDDLDEGLNAAALLDQFLAHAAGDLSRVALDSGDDGVGEGVRFGAIVVRLDNDDLYGAEASSAFYFPSTCPMRSAVILRCQYMIATCCRKEIYPPRIYSMGSRE